MRCPHSILPVLAGLRAYAGVAIPLLPHEVAMQGVRPFWPKKMPEEVTGLRQLAEACWQQKSQDRLVQHPLLSLCHQQRHHPISLCCVRLGLARRTA
jgi:hypothetical protein